MFGFLSGIFVFISRIFNSIVAMIKRILPYTMIAAAIYFGFGGVWAPTLFGSTLTITALTAFSDAGLTADAKLAGITGLASALQAVLETASA